MCFENILCDAPPRQFDHLIREVAKTVWDPEGEQQPLARDCHSAAPPSSFFTRRFNRDGERGCRHNDGLAAAGARRVRLDVLGVAGQVHRAAAVIVRPLGGARAALPLRCCLTGFVARTPPLPCCFPWRRHHLCFVVQLTSWRRHCLCRVVLLPSSLRYCLRHVFPLPSWLRHHISPVFLRPSWLLRHSISLRPLRTTPAPSRQSSGSDLGRTTPSSCSAAQPPTFSRSAEISLLSLCSLSALSAFRCASTGPHSPPSVPNSRVHSPLVARAGTLASLPCRSGTPASTRSTTRSTTASTGSTSSGTSATQTVRPASAATPPWPRDRPPLNALSLDRATASFLCRSLAFHRRSSSPLPFHRLFTAFSLPFCCLFTAFSLPSDAFLCLPTAFPPPLRRLQVRRRAGHAAG